MRAIGCAASAWAIVCAASALVIGMIMKTTNTLDSDQLHAVFFVALLVSIVVEIAARTKDAYKVSFGHAGLAPSAHVTCEKGNSNELRQALIYSFVNPAALKIGTGHTNWLKRMRSKAKGRCIFRLAGKCIGQAELNYTLEEKFRGRISCGHRIQLEHVVALSAA